HVVHDGVLQGLVDHGVAAVFDDHGLAMVFLDVGRGLGKEAGHFFVFHLLAPRSGPVIPVDFDVVVGQVAAPGLGAGAAQAHVHPHQDVVLGQDFGGLFLAVGVVGRVFADVDFARRAGQPDADLVDGEIPRGVADGAEDAAPVGVPAKDRRLEQVRADHAAGDRPGGLQVGGAGHLAGDEDRTS